MCMQENDTDFEVPEPEAEIKCKQTGETFGSMEEFHQHKEQLMHDACVEATAGRLNEALSVDVEAVEDALDKDFDTVVSEALDYHTERSDGISLDLIDSDKEMVAGAVLQYIGFKMLNKSVCDD